MGRPSRDVLSSRVQQLQQSLRDDIHQDRLKIGDYIPSEVELAKRFHISKETVRRALDDLVAEGIIIKIRRVGNKVAGAVNTPASPADRDSTDSTVPAIKSVHAVDHSNESRSVDANPKETITIKLAYYPSLEQETKLSILVNLFEQLNPYIRIQLIPTPFPVELAEHGIADVFTISSWDHLKLRDRDSALKLLALPPVTERAHPLLESHFHNDRGQVTAAPFVYSPVVLCYNRDHLELCGIEEPTESWTWYTLLKHARTLSKELDLWGFAVHIQSLNRWPVFLLQNDYSFHANEEVKLSENPILWESLRIARDLIQQQQRSAPLLTEDDTDVERWFREGKASMIMTTYFGMNQFKHSNIRYGVAPLPSLRTADTLMLVAGLAQSSSTPHPELSSRLIQFLCGEAAQRKVRTETLSLPAHPTALKRNADLQGTRPEVEISMEQMWSHCKSYRDLNLKAKVIDAIRVELKGFWSYMEDQWETGERIELVITRSR